MSSTTNTTTDNKKLKTTDETINSQSITTTKTHSIFVPGRICLLGEHADWHSIEFSQYHPIITNSDNNHHSPLVLVCATQQGIYAYAQLPRNKKNNTIYLKSISATISSCPTAIEIPTQLFIEKDTNKKWQNQYHPFYHLQLSTIQEIINDLQINNSQVLHDQFLPYGIEIDNYKTDLPVKRGLSSSAAICVLTVRAINLVYGLSLDEMEYAYRGERAIGSLCGRMDQLVSILHEPGSVIAVTSFANNNNNIQYFPVLGGGGSSNVSTLDHGNNNNNNHNSNTFKLPDQKSNNNIVIVCISFLSAKSKNTSQILFDLRTACQDKKNIQINELFSTINYNLVQQAIDALKSNNGKLLGDVVNKALHEFDTRAAIFSIENLQAPLLHSLIENKQIKELTYGIKAVGAGGDGTALLITKGEDEANQLINIVLPQLSSTQTIEMNDIFTMKVSLMGSSER
jgi:galactokinase